MNAAELLKRTALFSGFSEKEIASVLGTAKERSFAADDVIIAEGHEGGRGFYLLLEGTAQARKSQTVLADFAVGDYFGEMALLLEDTPAPPTSWPPRPLAASLSLSGISGRS